MKTIFLPGASLKNKAWAEETAGQMGLTNYEIINWEGWKSPNPVPFDFNLELDKFLTVAADQKVNIIAKSIGTIVFAKSIEKTQNNIGRVILCGLPLGGEGLTKEGFSSYSNLKLLPADNILVIQNTNDPLGHFDKIAEFIKSINPGIKVIPKDRSDHNYPYPEDFKTFLSP